MMKEVEFINSVIAGSRITIPKNIRDLLGIAEGDKVRVKIVAVWHKMEASG